MSHPSDSSESSEFTVDGTIVSQGRGVPLGLRSWVSADRDVPEDSCEVLVVIWCGYGNNAVAVRSIPERGVPSSSIGCCTTLKAYRKLSSSCEIEIMRVISNELKVIGSDGLVLSGVLMYCMYRKGRRSLS